MPAGGVGLPGMQWYAQKHTGKVMGVRYSEHNGYTCLLLCRKNVLHYFRSCKLVKINKEEAKLAVSHDTVDEREDYLRSHGSTIPKRGGPTSLSKSYNKRLYDGYVNNKKKIASFSEELINFVWFYTNPKIYSNKSPEYLTKEKEDLAKIDKMMNSLVEAEPDG